jgi:hypothetical protein
MLDTGLVAFAALVVLLVGALFVPWRKLKKWKR